MRLEALERRDCPAVQAFFMAGVLTVTGDEGPNVIEFSRRSDGVVDLLGDGKKHTFEGVNKIVAWTGDGDDRVQGKIILWVRDATQQPDTAPFVLDLDTGAGNDAAQIEDDDLITFRDLNNPRAAAEIHVGLGTGADEFSLQLDDHEQVDLDLAAEDGSEKILIGLLVPAVQKVRAAAARINLNLGEGGNRLDATVGNFDDVAFSTNTSSAAERKPGSVLYFVVYASSSSMPHSQSVLDVDVDFQVAQTDEGSRQVDAADEVKVIASGFHRTSLDVNTAGGADLVSVDLANDDENRAEWFVDAAINLGVGNDTLSVQTGDSSSVDLDVDAGSGDDLVTISDSDAGPVTGRITGIAADPLDAVIDLGTGADKLVFQVEDHDTVNVDVDSADSFDSVKVGVKYPLAHRVPWFDTRSVAVDVNLEGGGHSVVVQTQEVDVVDVNVVVYAGRATSDPTGNTVYISTSGGGVWRATVELGGDGNLLAVNTKDVDHVELDAIFSGDSNTVQFVGTNEQLVGIDFRPACVIDLNFLGGGGNVVDVSTNDFLAVATDVLALGGGNKVEINQQGRILVATDQGIWTSSTNLMLKGDGNEIGFKTEAYDRVDLDLDLAGNDNRLEIGLLLPAVQKVREAAARVSLEIVGSNNQGSVSNQGYNLWRTNFGRTASSSDSTSDGTRQTSGFLVTFDRPIDPVQGGTPTGTVTFFIDGNSQVPGSDSFEVHGQGFGAATVDADTAGGNDSIWIDLDAPLQLDLATGDGDDDVRVGSQPQRWFSEGPAPIHQLSIDTGAGDDTVNATVLPSVTDLVIDRFESAAIVIDSGEGNDNVFVQTLDVDDLHLDLATGAGNDTVALNSRILYIGTGETNNADLELDLSDDDDKAEISIDGYINILLGVKAGTGHDHVGIQKLGSKQLILQGEGTYSGQHVDLGSGNDRLVASSQDVIHDATFVDAGDGNDTVETRSNVTAVWLTVGFFEVTNDVKTGAGDDEVSIHNEGISVDNTRVDTGEGNDTVEFDSRAGVGVLKSTDGGRSFIENLGTVTFTFTLGFGDDRAKINTIGYGRVNAQVDAGDGDDTIVSNSSPTPAGATAGILYAAFHNNDLNLGGGNDHLTIETLGAVNTNTFVDAGDGDDTIISTSAPTSPAAKPQPVLIVIASRDYFLGAGDDWLVIDASGETRSDIYIDAGAGNDQVKVKPLFAFHVEDLDSPAQLDISANLRDGDDRLEIDATGYGRVNSFIDTDAGQDRVSNRLYVGTLSFAGHDTHLNAVTLLGAGDDHLEFDTSGYAQGKFLIVGGDGDDEIHTRHRMFAVVDRTKLSLVILLGAGDDTLAMQSSGYRGVKTAINTGPAGDGRDSVSASHQSQRRSSRKHNVRMNLDGGRDVYRHTSKGYAVQKTVRSPVSVEWVFVS